MEERYKSLLPILLVGFIPSISVIFGIKIIENELHSQIFFVICKLWIFIIPTVWFFYVEKNIFSRELPSRKGLEMGTATGLIMSIIIILTWIVFEDSINLEEMINTLNSKGLSDVNLYVMGMIYWIFINSLLEEYVLSIYA